MNKALVVARWEFIATVTRVPYIIAVVGLPLFYGGMFTIAGFSSRNAAVSSSRTPSAVVDQAHVVDLPFAAERSAERDAPAPNPGQEVMAMAARRSPAAAAVLNELTATPLPLVTYADTDTALAALRARTVNSVFVVGPDYMTTGQITSYARAGNMFGQQADRQRQAQLADAIRAGILKTAAAGSPQVVSRAFGPTAHITRMRLENDGQFVPSGNESALGPFAGSFGVFMLLSMSIFMSAGYLQQATIADRTNRMIEILFSSVDPDDLVLGKLLGLGGAGLMQVGIYLALFIVPGAAALSIFQIALSTLALSVAYFFLAYLIFACLMIGTGMLGRTAQEGAQLSAIWILLASLPMFFIANISTAPNGVLARMLSFFPLTSPMTMMLRIFSTDIAPAEIIASMVLDAVAIVLIFKGASRVFRASALMYGKRATLPELIRWIRAA